MMESYFFRESCLRQLRSGPLKEQLDSLAAKLKDRGYCRSGGQQMLYICGKFNIFLELRGLGIKDISNELVETFIARQKELTKINGIENAIRHLLDHLRELGLIPPLSTPRLPQGYWSILLRNYGQYLASVRGISESYISINIRCIADFLNSYQAQHSPEDFRNLQGSHLLDYLKNVKKKFRDRISILRVFCRYLHGEGLLKTDISVCLPKLRHVKLKSPPDYLPWDKVLKIIAAIDNTHPDGMRDRAIILLLACLGLRASEVLSLKIKNIDWRNGTINIEATKSRKDRMLPLPNIVGEAIACYLRYGRPTKDLPYVFLRHRAPGGTLKCGAISGIVTNHAKRANVTLPPEKCNILRHSLATYLVNSETPIKTISDLLGHASIDTTAIYTMVDMNSLSKVIMPVPGR